MKINDLSQARRLDRSRHAAPQVFELLRGMILSLELTPGTVLSRADLASGFGISQTPVRDALIRLGEEGLVDIYPQRRTLVSQINVTSARQAHFLRRSIELEVVRTLAQGTDAAIVAQLRSTIERQTALCNTKDYHEFVVVDQTFHCQMYEAAGVPDLWDLVRRISGHIDRLRRLHLPVEGKTVAIVRDHGEIVDAIECHDPDAAQSTIRKHLSDTLSQIEKIRSIYPDYVTFG
jgi:DNA-binding GntR family transcriptional regulator